MEQWVKLSLYGSSTSINILASWMHSENEWPSTDGLAEDVCHCGSDAECGHPSPHFLGRSVSCPVMTRPGLCVLLPVVTHQAWNIQQKKEEDRSEQTVTENSQGAHQLFPFPPGNTALLHFPAPLSVKWDHVTEFCPVEGGRGNYSTLGWAYKSSCIAL